MSNGKISTAKISEPNRKWGICGFASCIGAMYKNGFIGKTIRADHLETRLLAEVKTYIRMLQADGSTLVEDIQAFTRTFGDATFSIERFIKQIDTFYTIPSNTGLAMPPHALVDYLQRCYDMKKARLAPLSPALNNVILGLVDPGGGPYKGLKHWVFKRDVKRVYNWGEKKSLAEVMKDVGPLTIGFQVAF
jgi:hypothetical protein